MKEKITITEKNHLNYRLCFY